MDQTQGMADGAYLELLNKPNKSMQEQNDLQAEIKRREDATKAQAGTAAPVEEAQVTQTPVEPATQAAPEVQAAAEQPSHEVNVAYDLTQLTEETETAITYLATQPNTLAIEMAQAAFTQAAYWTKLASQGK